MSETKQPINDFEQLLASISPADPQSSPMQIMYLAGQQSTKVNSSLRSPSRIWKIATLVSSSIAAGLLMLVTLPQSEPNSITNTSEVEVVDSNDMIASQEIGTELPEPALQQTVRLPRRSPQYVFDPMQIAISQRSRRSIEMFEGFEIKPMTDLNERQELPQ